MQMCDNTVFVLGGEQYVSYRAVIGVVTVVTAATVVIPVVSCHQPTAAAGNPACTSVARPSPGNRYQRVDRWKPHTLVAAVLENRKPEQYV